MAYTVYCHTCKRNGKKYVGLTKVKPEKRWNHGKSYQGNDKFWKDIQKYGWDKGFTHEIVAVDLTKEQAKKLEYDLIEQFNTIQCGYNREPGGRAPEPTFLCKTLTEFRSAYKKRQKSGPFGHSPTMDQWIEEMNRADQNKSLADLLNLLASQALKKTLEYWATEHWSDLDFLLFFEHAFNYELLLLDWVVNDCKGEQPIYKTMYDRVADWFFNNREAKQNANA
jgi:hypothetical protein